jgi:hypothetical protein
LTVGQVDRVELQAQIECQIAKRGAKVTLRSGSPFEP